MGRPKGSKNKTTKTVKSVVQLNEDDKILYRKLTDYLQEVYLQTVGYEPPWALFMTQIKDIKKNYDINYDVILLVLKYMIQIEGIDITDKDTLGLIPYYVDRANQYIEKYKSIRQSIKDFKYDEHTIIIKGQSTTQRRHKKNERFDT
jgi:hypothetical protein